MTLALSKGWILRQVYVNNALLNGDLTEDVFMVWSLCFKKGIGLVCRLKKALYGLVLQSLVVLLLILALYLPI